MAATDVEEVPITQHLGLSEIARRDCAMIMIQELNRRGLSCTQYLIRPVIDILSNLGAIHGFSHFVVKSRGDHRLLRLLNELLPAGTWAEPGTTFYEMAQIALQDPRLTISHTCAGYRGTITVLTVVPL